MTSEQWRIIRNGTYQDKLMIASLSLSTASVLTSDGPPENERKAHVIMGLLERASTAIEAARNEVKFSDNRDEVSLA